MKKVVLSIACGLLFGLVSEASHCSKILDRFGRHLQEHRFLLGLLVKTQRGNVYFSYGTLIDGHKQLWAEIENHKRESDDSPITQILWAGEMEGDIRGLLRVNEVAGIIRDRPTESAENSVRHLKAWLNQHQSFRGAISTQTRLEMFFESSEHLRPEMKYLARFRHNFVGSWGKVYTAVKESLRYQGVSEKAELSEFWMNIAKTVSTEMRGLLSILDRLGVEVLQPAPRAELDRWLTRIAQDGKVSPDEMQALEAAYYDLGGLLNQPSPIISVFKH